jgi:hypothetical protein
MKSIAITNTNAAPITNMFMDRVSPMSASSVNAQTLCRKYVRWKANSMLQCSGFAGCEQMAISQVIDLYRKILRFWRSRNLMKC